MEHKNQDLYCICRIATGGFSEDFFQFKSRFAGVQIPGIALLPPCINKNRLQSIHCRELDAWIPVLQSSEEASNSGWPNRAQGGSCLEADIMVLIS